MRKRRLDEQSKMSQSLVSAENVGMYLIPSAQKYGRLTSSQGSSTPALNDAELTKREIPRRASSAVEGSPAKTLSRSLYSPRCKVRLPF